MKEIFIHVGAGKTGTSAIQEFLMLNEAKLLKEGLHIPTIGRDESSKFIFHHELAGGRERHMDDESTFELWKNIASLQHEKMLISSEIFHSRVKKDETKKLFYEIKSLLENFKIKIIFYVRRDEQWLQSAYEQWIKDGNKRDGETIHEFIQKPMISLAEQIYLFADIFGKGNIIVRPFEKEQFVNGNIFDDFFNILGIKVNEEYKYPLKNSNPRLSLDALEFKRVFNTVCKDKKEAQIFTLLLQEYSTITDEESSSVFRKANLLSKEDFKRLSIKNEPLYKKIAEDFLDRKDGVLFYGDYEGEQNEYEFNLEDLTKITSFLLLRMHKRINSINAKINKLGVAND